MHVQDTEGLVYSKYEVLIEGKWKTIDLSRPFAEQIRGMQGYRLFNHAFKMVKQSSLKYNQES